MSVMHSGLGQTPDPKIDWAAVQRTAREEREEAAAFAAADRVLSARERRIRRSTVIGAVWFGLCMICLVAVVLWRLIS